MTSKKFKIQKYNKIREYNHLKKKKYGPNYGLRNKDGKMSGGMQSLQEEGDSAKDRVLKNKERKKLEEQKRKEMALIQACKENVAAKEAARIKEKNQYRPSSAMVNIFGDKKKIEEDYAFYDQPVEDDKEDELLESIMEEVDAEDEEEKDLREDIKELDRQIQQKQK